MLIKRKIHTRKRKRKKRATAVSPPKRRRRTAIFLWQGAHEVTLATSSKLRNGYLTAVHLFVGSAFYTVSNFEALAKLFANCSRNVRKTFGVFASCLKFSDLL